MIICYVVRLTAEGAIPSCKHVTREEILCFVHSLTINCTNKLANIPEEILLKDAFASDAEFRAKCIQARFGGVRLPSTVKDCHGGVIDQGNLVAVQVYSGDAIISDDFSVTRAPVLVCLNSGAHLLFDLTHWCRCLVDCSNIAEDGGNCNPLCATTSTGRLGDQIDQSIFIIEIYDLFSHLIPCQFLVIIHQKIMCQLRQSVYIHRVDNVVDIVLFEMEKIELVRRLCGHQL